MATSHLFLRPDVLGERTELDRFLEKRLALGSKELAEAGIMLYSAPPEL